MRGTLGASYRGGCAGGIIPAHAGNTSVALDKVLHIRDHPRACGEHHRRRFRPRCPAGSSPRMRGTPSTRPRTCSPTGIIPAHAGNTRHLTATASFAGDHPRACGEHSFRWENLSWRAWIIPAHAGNTSSIRPLPRRARDHPRACGEHSCLAFRPAPCPGSSPRMRGTLKRVFPACKPAGIIPAHAGNTTYHVTDHSSFRDHPRACGEHSAQ